MDKPLPTERGLGFVRMVRTPETLELVRDPHAFTLLALIALRARWREGFSVHSLKPGEALIGDFKTLGMKRGAYREATKRLATWGFATFRTTNKGTIATLTSSTIFDLSEFTPSQQASHPATNGQPSSNHPATTNEEGIRREKGLNKGKKGGNSFEL